MYGNRLNHGGCPTLSIIPEHLTINTFKLLVKLLRSLCICCGNPDKEFVEMCEAKGGKIISPSGSTAAYVDNQKTVRAQACMLLIEGKRNRCQECIAYRNNIRSIYSNYSKKKEPSTSSNFRYLSSPQKKRRLQLVKQSLRNKTRQLQRLKKKLERLTAKHGVIADDSLQSDLVSVLMKSREEIEKLPMNDFKKVFWEQQVYYSNYSYWVFM